MPFFYRRRQKIQIRFWQNRREAVTQSHRDLSQVSLVAILHSSCDCNLFYFFGRVPIVRAELRFAKSARIYAEPIRQSRRTRLHPSPRIEFASLRVRSPPYGTGSPPYGVRFAEPPLNPTQPLFATLRRPPAVAHPCCTTHPIGYPRTPAPRDLHSFHK